MNTKLKVLLAVAISSITLLSCLQQTNTQDVPENWLFKVGENYIGPNNIEIAYQNLPLEVKEKINEENQKQYINSVMSRMIQKEILYQEAQIENIAENESFKKILERLENQYEFQKKQLYVDFLLNQKADSNVVITDADIKAYYDQNKTLFDAHEQRNISHILVKTKKEADDLYAKLYKGASFPKLAKEQSIHQITAQNGGVIGNVKQGTMLPQIDEIAFKLEKQGYFAKPIESEMGWHIVMLNDIINVPEVKFEAIKDAIANEISIAKTNQARLDFYNSIKDNYKIEENKSLVDEQPSAADNNDG